MSAISEKLKAFGTQFKAFFDRQDAARTGVEGDIQSLKDAIARLQATADGWTPEDQAELDSMTTRVQAATEKLEAIDALTPPTPPTA